MTVLLSRKDNGVIINTALYRDVFKQLQSVLHKLFFCRVQQQYEEERLNRLLQEEAVKFLWKQVCSYLSSPNILSCSIFI